MFDYSYKCLNCLYELFDNKLSYKKKITYTFNIPFTIFILILIRIFYFYYYSNYLKLKILSKK